MAGLLGGPHAAHPEVRGIAEVLAQPLQRVEGAGGGEGEFEADESGVGQRPGRGQQMLGGVGAQHGHDSRTQQCFGGFGPVGGEGVGHEALFSVAGFCGAVASVRRVRSRFRVSGESRTVMKLTSMVTDM